MNNLVKLLVIAGLALGIFGGGGFLAYRLFFKSMERRGNLGQAVVTPTPDQGITMLNQAKQQLGAGDRFDAERILSALIQTFPDSIKSADAKQLPADLIFKANGLESMVIQPGQRLIIPKGQFSLLINRKRQDVTLLKNGNFFRWYKPLEVNLPPRIVPGQFKTREKIAWSDGARVAFGEKKYLGSSRWIVVNDNGVTLYSETNPNPQTPNAQKPNAGIMLGPTDMEELFALVTKETPVIVK